VLVIEDDAPPVQVLAGQRSKLVSHAEDGVQSPHCQVEVKASQQKQQDERVPTVRGGVKSH
jgi:hypothetical protein